MYKLTVRLPALVVLLLCSVSAAAGCLLPAPPSRIPKANRARCKAPCPHTG